MKKKNYNRTLGTCTCGQCGEDFEKPQSEITRNLKLDRKNFCSRRCVGLNNVKNLNGKRSNYDISQHAGDRRDKFTGFRYYLRTIKARRLSKGIDVTVTLEDLKNKWDEQNGVCPYMGVGLVLYNKVKAKWNFIPDYLMASIDRIDSSKGYIPGNIQWVSKSINYMKNEMSHKMTQEVCKLIAENYNKKTL